MRKNYKMRRNYIFSKEQKKVYGVNYVKVEGNWIEFTDVVSDLALNQFDPTDTQIVAVSEYVLPTRSTRHKGQPVGIFINGKLLVLHSDREIPDEFIAAIELLDGKPDEEVHEALINFNDTLRKYQTQSKPSGIETLPAKTLHETKKDYQRYLDELSKEIDEALDQKDMELFNQLTTRYNLAKAEM